MKLLTDAQVRSAISIPPAIAAVRAAYLAFGQGRAANQSRVRTAAAGSMLSTMGAVMPSLGVSGAKIYSTVEGRFRFVVVLFDAVTGAPLCTMSADALTEIRTAATTAVAADIFCRPDARVLTVFGTGIQARAHVRAMLQVRDFSQVLLCGIEGTEAFARSVQAEHQIPCHVTGDTATAVRRADGLVTATRATEPLFDGRLLQDHVFVAAIGATKPASREIDAATVGRARHLVVEERSQALAESGELADLPAGAAELTQLGDWLALGHTPQPGLTVYKAVGIGLSDVALAAAVWRQVSLTEG
ncbi:ornithine cyclodeaminase [Polaromonas sp. YR568]|uniref:ornithine cyclodeaminase family protein n=1 Tax=Polaromonas sp. YR568 TaxID=1855301 RepID=UPI0008DF0EA7|nr:ornithine cyclodeaminase family protein [Polaromonas sp. YR568]SFU34025.1 ornithine cyclodeaminase [Polaromonas sp. YR568]